MRRGRKVLLFILVLGLLTAVFAAGCGKGKDETKSTAGQPVSGGIFRYPLLDDPTSLDPAQFDEELGIAVGKEIFDGLVDIDFKTNKVVGAHAEKWDVRDNMIYTFSLRKGAKFHNGREVTAEDFKYSFERLLDPATGATVGWVLENVSGAADKISGQAKETAGIKVVDKYTLEITLDKPYPSFLSRLAYPGAAVVDRESIEQAKKTGKAFAAPGAGPDTVIGTGPFKLAQWVPKSVIKIVRNEDYYSRKAYLDGVDFRIIPDETTTLNEFRAGNLDFTDRIPPGQAAMVEKEFTGQVVRNREWNVDFLGLNLAKDPFKNNVKLRQAMNYAIDREGIIKAVLEGLGTPAKGILSPGMAEYNDRLKGYTYDPAKASALLAEAGYPNGQGLPELELAYNNRETIQKIAEAVQDQFKAVGIKVKLRGLPLPVYRRELGSGSLGIFRFSWSADSLDAGSVLYPLFHSGGEANLTGYANPDVDKLLEQAQAAVDEQERVALYREAEQKIVDDAPILGLYHPLKLYLKGSSANGLEENPMHLVYMNNIWLTH